MDLKDKVVIVTGGASGLGAACVKKFIQAGAKAIIADLNEEQGEKFASDFLGKAEFSKCDVTKEDDAQAAVNLAWDKFGGLHGLINCAGIGIPEKLIDKEGNPHRLKTFSKTIEVNLIGSFNMSRIAAASMVAKNPSALKERGIIINTASIAAFEGQLGQCAYSASKGGLVAMTLPMARELAPYFIRVMTIAPGIFDTPMLAGLPENVRDSLGKQVPYPSRLGRPDEYAQIAQQIFENEMLNGETIRLDGAMRMAAR